MKNFKQRIQSKKNMVGTFIQTPHPTVSEFVGKLGFDFIVVDSEHSAINIETIQTMLLSVESSSTYGIVRIPAIRSEYIANHLDAGADALLVPQIKNTDDVLRIKDAALYPPEGKRGIGLSRVNGYGLNLMEKMEYPNEETTIILQIETKEALDQLDEILSIEFYDMIFIGPSDLSMNLGVFGEEDNSLLVETIDEIIIKSKKYGKKVGIFADNIDSANHWLEQGVNMIAFGTELTIMGQHAKQCLNELISKK